MSLFTSKSRVDTPSHLGHDLGALLAGVVVDGGAVGLVAVAEDHDVVAAAERVRVDGLRVYDHLRVVSGSLFGGGTIEVPLGAAESTHTHIEACSEGDRQQGGRRD